MGNLYLRHQELVLLILVRLDDGCVGCEESRIFFLLVDGLFLPTVYPGVNRAVIL